MVAGNKRGDRPRWTPLTGIRGNSNTVTAYVPPSRRTSRYDTHLTQGQYSGTFVKWFAQPVTMQYWNDDVNDIVDLVPPDRAQLDDLWKIDLKRDIRLARGRNLGAGLKKRLERLYSSENWQNYARFIPNAALRIANPGGLPGVPFQERFTLMYNRQDRWAYQRFLNTAKRTIETVIAWPLAVITEVVQSAKRRRLT